MKREKNYEINANCFKLNEKIKTDLIYGDLGFISNPLITIVIPTYKRSDLIEDTIDSILRLEDVDFYWDVLIIDNEEIDGSVNETEKIIRKINSPRILYYRNQKNIGPIGNWNRGIELARGKWISFLHDDDILMGFYLKRVGAYLDFYDKKPGKPLGYISSSYNQFTAGLLTKNHDVFKKIMDCEYALKGYFKNKPLVKVTNRQLCATGHIGYTLPSNGTLMRKEAIIEFGGFNESLGIGNDTVLPFCLRKKYTTYSTLCPMGHYRWYDNISMEEGSIYKIVNFYYEFREYIYNTTYIFKIFGKMFYKLHHENFVQSMIEQSEEYCEKAYDFSDFEKICGKEKSKLKRFIYKNLIQRVYKFTERIRWRYSGFKNERED